MLNACLMNAKQAVGAKKRFCAQALQAMLVLGAVMLSALTACTPNPANNATDAQGDASAGNTQANIKTLAVATLVEHPSLDDIYAGVIDGLAEEGYVDGQNLMINYQSAQGNMATVGQISKQFVADNPDVIVAITTPTAQSIAAATNTIPIVYTAVSDPVAARLVSLDNTPISPNITGLSSQLPLEPQIELFSKIKPSAKNIGFVYSPGEANAVAIKQALETLLPKYGMTLVDVPANRSADVADAMRALAGRADLVYTSMDNGVASAMEAMAAVASELNIPIITSDEFSVRRGATAALGVNDYDFGKATAQLVLQIFNGQAPNQVPAQVMDDLTLYVSPKHATLQGVSINMPLLQKGVNVDEIPARKPL